MMPEDYDNSLNFFTPFLLIAVIAVIFASGCTFGSRRMTTAMKIEAVKNGHAVWLVDESGNPTFHWKDHRP